MATAEPIVAGAVDYRSRPVSRSTSGGWKAALFIIGVEVSERFAYYGISSNLITYLTGRLGESTAAAAAAVNTWSGVSTVLPLLGAFIADSYLGRYRTVIVATLFYILGLGMLTLSSELPGLRPPKCGDPTTCRPSGHQVAFFYFSLYLVAVAQSGHKPCVQAFGADQFDQNDPDEQVSRSSFFNWWYFALCSGVIIAFVVLSYIQDNIGWGLGFGIPCIAMAIALVVFLLGARTYRYYCLEDKNPFARIGKGFVAMARKWLASRKNNPASQGGGEGAHQTTFDQSNVRQVEEAKGVLKLLPIGATCLIYAVVFAQSSTFFTKQGSTLDRRIGHKIQVPPAALQSFIGISIVAFIPIYDRVIVPTARKFTKIPSGITMLQRIGIGMFISIVAMIAAALVETKRLKTATDSGLADSPKMPLPMSLWWLVPQYVLFGVADVFTMVGLQEFFYDQVPDSLRSLGLALYLCIFGIGSFISSCLISVINRISSSWFSNNLNHAHLDYFYWLLAGLSTVQLVVYIYIARSYVYKKKGDTAAIFLSR